MKHGVSSYSFCQYLDDGRLDLVGVIKKAAELGFDGIELANITENYPYDIEELKKAAEEAGIEVCSWATSADFLQDIPTQIENLKKEIDRAAYLGCKVLRTDIYHYEMANPYIDEVICALKVLASYCQEKGMVLTTENHGGPLCTAERLDRLFQIVDHENFGLLCDFANFVDAGEDPLKAVSLLKYRVRHVHMKDVHILDGQRIFPGEGWYMNRSGDYTRCAITGQGNVPMYKCMKVLQDAGYEGYLIQEFEGIEDCVYAVEKGLKYAKRLLNTLNLGVWSDEV